MTVYFRQINDQLEYWTYPLMIIDRIFSKLHIDKLISTLNIRSRYYNITVAQDSEKCTTFTSGYGKYEFL